MKAAHIVTARHEVGDKIIAICGEVHRVKVRWADIPDDKPICRKCVDVAVQALDQADALIERARMRSVIVGIHFERLSEELEPDLLLLDRIAESNQDFLDRRDAKANEKAEQERVAQTCTCTWSDFQTRVLNEDCPIHGKVGEEVEEGTE